MGTITSRISQFRGINRSVQQNGLDASYAYNAVNVDIVGGKLTNKIGSKRLVSSTDVPVAHPIILFTNTGNYLILRDKFVDLTTGSYDPGTTTRPLQNIVNDTLLYMKGVGNSSILASIDSKDVMIVSGMLGVDTGYYKDGDYYIDGNDAVAAVYYLGSEETPKVHCRKFGSGLYMLKDVSVSDGSSAGDATITKLVADYTYANLTDEVKDRMKLDGIYLFDRLVGDEVEEDEINNAYMFLKVTNIAAQSGTGKTEITVKTTRSKTSFKAGSYMWVRGGCSDMPTTHMAMYYGRLFAAANRSNKTHPRRLYWSCLPGDGRTIEDWTMSDASVDTSGGHVDVGDPTDGYITGLVVVNSQMMIFTQRRLWRLYGTAPSNYRLEKVGDLEGTPISNPVEVDGTVYWLTLAGMAYYNSSYISTVNDGYSTRHLLEEIQANVSGTLNASSVHATLFDGSLMFAFDRPVDNKCLVLRYELNTGDVIKYIVPCEDFLQQFTDVVKDTFGMFDNAIAQNETRYLQALVHDDGTMTMTQWNNWGHQEFGWYDANAVESVWETEWDDLRNPEVVKKVQTVIMRGSGEFDLAFETEINKSLEHVDMPQTKAKVKEVVPKYAEGRVMRMSITSDRMFEIEPYMTMLFEAGSRR